MKANARSENSLIEQCAQALVEGKKTIVQLNIEGHLYLDRNLDPGGYIGQEE